MRRSIWWSWAGLAVSIGLASGCGKDPFGAPARAPSPPTTTSAEESTRTIFLVLPGAPTGDMELWALRAQREANERRAIFRIMGFVSADSPSKQPDVVRRAVTDGASALIVIPGAATDLGPALAEAEAKGVPVILLGRSVPAPPGSRPFTYVDFEPYETSARRLASTAIEDAKKAGRPADGSALILTDEAGDHSTNPRVAALKAAAQALGLKRVVATTIDGTKIDDSVKVVVEMVKGQPDLAIVLADGNEATRVAAQARLTMLGKPPFFVAGYVGHRGGPVGMSFTRESCWFDGRNEELARLAVVSALARLQGETVPERVDLPPSFHRGLADVATEADSPAYRRKERNVQ